jgi:hypothetical protein
MIKVDDLASTITTSLHTAYRLAFPNADQPLSSWINQYKPANPDGVKPANTWLTVLVDRAKPQKSDAVGFDQLEALYFVSQFMVAVSIVDDRRCRSTPDDIGHYIENLSGGADPRRQGDRAVHESDFCKAALRGVQLAYRLTSKNDAADLSRWIAASNDNALGEYAPSIDGICRMIDDAMIEHAQRIALLPTHQRLALKVAREIFALGKLLEDAGGHGIVPATNELLDMAA